MYTPNKAKVALVQLGEQLRMARKRRQWTIAELAKKVEVSSPTIMALEKGEPTVSLGLFVSALWVLGLETELLNLANPTDTEGIKLMNARLPKKIRISKKALDNDF